MFKGDGTRTAAMAKNADPLLVPTPRCRDWIAYNVPQNPKPVNSKPVNPNPGICNPTSDARKSDVDGFRMCLRPARFSAVPAYPGPQTFTASLWVEGSGSKGLRIVLVRPRISGFRVLGVLGGFRGFRGLGFI